MDSAPIHMTDQTELKFKNTGTRRKLQVLDISVNKSFKSHLQKRKKNGWSMASRSSRNRDASSISKRLHKTLIDFYGGSFDDESESKEDEEDHE
ncbi:hypothetical protein MXB_1269 [Myxobolus squamalis]|nr:hypothetical protein MXB_1269 [Myxobolus squamalis]